MIFSISVSRLIFALSLSYYSFEENGKTRKYEGFVVDEPRRW